jgi:2-dehydro-3-deoxygalactonokinase
MKGRMERALLIGLDWGTSSLRAYLYGSDGRILQEKSAPSGVMHLERFIPAGEPSISREKLFEAAFSDICGDWLAENGKDLPVLACGMVGSTAGWREAVYLRTPVGPSGLTRALTKVSLAGGSAVQIVPGICAAGEAGKSFPEILRGEETQVAGILSKIGNSSKSENLLIGLPGTHSKWVFVQDRRIVSFSTFVTGELYALLTNYSMVAKTQKKPEQMDDKAFRLGLRMARASNPEAAGGLLSTIFSTRSKRVLGELKEGEQPDYLSGLLIGEELAGVERILARDKRTLTDFSRILIAGDPSLCARYGYACKQAEWPIPQVVDGATAAGLWSVAREAGLTD